MQNFDKRPIGVFDSGMGGLTTVRQLTKLLPNEDIIYLGDTARLPYGNKSKNAVIRFSIQNALYLLKFNVKLIIVACNTSSSLAINNLKKSFKVPIIDVIEPGIKKALAVTGNNRIGIIGTNATIDSNAYQKKILKICPSVKIFAKSCPLFVPLVEEGWLNNKIAESVVKEYLMPFKNKEIDTLVLGCTHYPLLKAAIKKVMGSSVNLVDSARQVAADARALLNRMQLNSNKKAKAHLRFFLTDKPYKFQAIGSKFLGQNLTSVKEIKDLD